MAAMTNDRPVIDVRIIEGPVEPVPSSPFPEGGGGECIFLGRTRRAVHEVHGALVQLHYQAYRPLAVRVLSELAEEASRRFGCLAVRVHHAVGDVPVGEASVLVQVACSHREEAFLACRFLIDRLKADAPIWKHEQWAGGATWARGVPVQAEP